MNEREKIIVGALLVILMFAWLGFVIHVSPRFAGTLIGGVFGVSGALLMLVPLLYLIVKRILPLKRAVTQRISMRTLLTLHIYAGIVGPILALIHTGHKFQSLLGIVLTTMMLLVVMSGFVGRYLMSYISQSTREKQTLLHQLEQKYHQTALELAQQPEKASVISLFSGFFSRPLFSLFVPSTLGIGGELPLPSRVLGLSDSIADLEYAIKTRELFRDVFSKWLKFHIVISFILYGLLALHIWAGLYYGLRWFK